MKFDAAYYDRFYVDPETRATSVAEQTTLGTFIAAYLRYLDVEIERILDLGCGLGTLLNTIQQAFPGAVATGVERSAYLCETHGWIRGSVEDYADAPHDLVICSDVLGYLDDTACGSALDNLARLTAGALYLSVLTREDLDVCDPDHTDALPPLQPLHAPLLRRPRPRGRRT